MILYLEITTDKYKLPVAVADSLRELANMRHSTASSIFKSIKYCRERNIEGRYIKVEIDEED